MKSISEFGLRMLFAQLRRKFPERKTPPGYLWQIFCKLKIKIHEKVGNKHEIEWREMAPVHAVYFCKCDSEASLLCVHTNLMV
jgi:hypothetical protein